MNHSSCSIIVNIIKSWHLLTTVCINQGHTLRHRWPSMTACPACWAMGTNELYSSMRWKKTYFVLGRLEQPKQDKNRLYQHNKPNEPRNSFICSSWVPIQLGFSSQQSPPLSSLSGISICTYTIAKAWVGEGWLTYPNVPTYKIQQNTD
jgi:hypothetical protein